MAEAGIVKKPHMGRRRLVIIGLGLVGVAAGLFVLADQAWVAGELQPIVGSSLGASGDPTGGLTPYGSLSFVVYAIGIGLIGAGLGLVRMVFHSSVTSYAMGGGMGAAGMNPQALDAMMKASMAQMNSMTTATPPKETVKETVKVKCRNCGSLEEEDAAFCHKCGQAM